MLRNIVALQEKIRAFGKNESGATAIEYGLIAAGVAVAIIFAVGALGDQLVALFEEIAAGL